MPLPSQSGPNDAASLGEEDQADAVQTPRRVNPNETIGEPSASAPPRRALSDSQVMRILEERGAGDRRSALQEPAARHIPLLPPEETGKRRALRYAVGRGVPVSFAVQLRWSAEPIDARAVARDPIFRFYTLYTTRARQAGREWHCLRLGFFSDAISAKQVALYLRPSYDSAAVIPVGAGEKEAAARSGDR
jgi:hypothetical protein